MASHAIFRQEQQGFRDASIAVVPDGKRIVFCGRGDRGDNADLYTLHRNTLKVERITGGPHDHMYPSMSSDGRRILFTLRTAGAGNGRSGSLYCQNLDDTTPERRRLTAGGRFDAFAVFSPDQSQLVFARAARCRPYSFGGYVWDEWDLFTARSDGTRARRVTSQAYRSASGCQWLPGTDSLVFAAETPGQKASVGLFAIKAKGESIPRQMLEGRCTDPSASRQGDDIVFISDRAKQYDYEVWRMRADGTKAVQVTRNASFNICPRFTPDGRQILFLSDPQRRGQPELWQIEADGTGLQRVADHRLFDAPLAWKP